MFDFTDRTASSDMDNPLSRVVSALERIAEGMERANGMKGREDREPQRTLTPAEFAKALRLHPQTAMAWCRDGRVAAAKVGGKWHIPKQEVDRHLRGYHLVNGKKRGGV